MILAVSDALKSKLTSPAYAAAVEEAARSLDLALDDVGAAPLRGTRTDA
jgi:hypothetical protein